MLMHNLQSNQSKHIYSKQNKSEVKQIALQYMVTAFVHYINIGMLAIDGSNLGRFKVSTFMLT